MSEYHGISVSESSVSESSVSESSVSESSVNESSVSESSVSESSVSKYDGIWLCLCTYRFIPAVRSLSSRSLMLCLHVCLGLGGVRGCGHATAGMPRQAASLVSSSLPFLCICSHTLKHTQTHIQTHTHAQTHRP